MVWRCWALLLPLFIVSNACVLSECYVSIHMWRCYCGEHLLSVYLLCKPTSRSLVSGETSEQWPNRGRFDWEHRRSELLPPENRLTSTSLIFPSLLVSLSYPDPLLKSPFNLPPCFQFPDVANRIIRKLESPETHPNFYIFGIDFFSPLHECGLRLSSQEPT